MYASHFSQFSRRLDELSAVLQQERSARLAMERQLRETQSELATVRLQTEIQTAAAQAHSEQSHQSDWRAELEAVEARLADNLTVALERQQSGAEALRQSLQRERQTAAAEQRQALTLV